MASDKDILESLVAGGIVGAALGALLSNKNKEETTLLGAIASAAILATYKANEAAKKTNVPMYVEENGNLYQIQSGSAKKLVRKIDKPSVKLQEHFKLK
jgi:uncharacterized membrane protein YebE (DUF533 family)